MGFLHNNIFCLFLPQHPDLVITACSPLFVWWKESEENHYSAGSISAGFEKLFK